MTQYLRSGSTADYYDQRPHLVTSLTKCVDSVYATHYYVKMFQNKAKNSNSLKKRSKTAQKENIIVHLTVRTVAVLMSCCLARTSSKASVKTQNAEHGNLNLAQSTINSSYILAML